MQDTRQVSRPMTRRDFVRNAAAATVAATVFPAIIPGSALGKNGAVAPSNRVVLAVIGCGPQGRGDMGNFLAQKDCQVTGVCDVKRDQLELARAAVNARYTNADCRSWHDFRELVARPDIDAVLVATPDHWHVLTALAAVQAGKDVYVEKPLAVSLEEGQVLRRAVQQRQRVFQFGTQQRSDRMFRLACELTRNGAVGRLRHVNVWAPGSAPGGSRKEVRPPEGTDYDFWLGPAAFQPHTEDRCSADSNRKTWWFIREYTLGFITGWGIHPMDIAAWGAGELMDGQVLIEGRGNFRQAEGVCDTATIWEAEYIFASGLTLTFVGVPNGGNRGAATGEPFLHGEEWKQRYRRIESHGTAFEGTEGWAHVDRAGINLQPENLIDRRPEDFKVRLTASSNHARNFLDCVKSRAETVCPVTAAVKADTLCRIADVALRLGRRLTFDFAKEQFVHDHEANARLKARPMRAPWHL